MAIYRGQVASWESGAGEVGLDPNALFFITEHAEVRGEAFTGQALGTLGRGGAGTS